MSNLRVFCDLEAVLHTTWSMFILGEVFLVFSEFLDMSFICSDMFYSKFVVLWYFESKDSKFVIWKDWQTTLILISYGWLGFFIIYYICYILFYLVGCACNWAWKCFKNDKVPEIGNMWILNIIKKWFLFNLSQIRLTGKSYHLCQHLSN